MRHQRSGGRPWWLGVLVAVVALVATGCDNDVRGTDGGARPVTLVVSDTWVQNHQGTGGGASSGEVQARLRALQEAIDRLRDETHTGWVGRQDDVTGYLGELSGGSWPGTATAFADEHGEDLFGVASSALRFGDPDTETVPNVTTTRATQSVGDVPVLDATLVFTGREPENGGARVTGVRGRVFPGLAVDTTPALTAEQATAAATEASGATTGGTPRLVVIPDQAGVLAWEVAVVGETTSGFGAGLYYIDATNGDLLQVRPASADLAPPVPSFSTAHRQVGHPTRTRGSARARDPEPNSVELTGNDPLGRPVTAYGLHTDGGYELVDTTTEAWDPATRTGSISTHDASGVGDAQLPGALVVSPTTTVEDADAIAAQSYSHAVMEFYEEMGRDSWDDQGGDLVSSIHYGKEDFCNAFFSASLSPPQMVYGNPCFLEGKQQSGTFVDPDVAGHEITHGVTDSSSGLLYTGQSGALNEAFSDYFGNLIGSRIHGKDDDSLGEDLCAGITEETIYCLRNPDGSVSTRYMLNGATMDDYLRILDPGYRLTYLMGKRVQDAGGVHSNSAIWNNALWSIRDRLAQVDGQPGTTSALVASFDRAVYGALTTRLTPNSGFFDARAAVEQVIIDSGLDPVVLRVAREVFDQDKICPGCPATAGLAGDIVGSGPQTQLHPEVSGDGDLVAWLDYSGASEVEAHVATAGVAGGAPTLSATDNLVDVGFAGEALITIDVNGQVTRTVGTDVQELDRIGFFSSVIGLGGSDAGAAWLAGRKTVTYVDADGNLTSADVPVDGSDRIQAVAAGGGSVAVGTQQGNVYVWSPGVDEFRRVGQVSDEVFDLATYAGTVFAIDKANHSVLFTADGQQAAVTDDARPFGATMSGDYVVWAERTEDLTSAVVPSMRKQYPETDLYLLSLATGKVYDLYHVRGQQGFPSISGHRLVWQDAAFGGDDIFTAEVPGGL
jgi:hypothetical protein